MLLNAQEEKEIVHNCAFAARNLGADAKCIADNHYAVEKCALRCTQCLKDIAMQKKNKKIESTDVLPIHEDGRQDPKDYSDAEAKGLGYKIVENVATRYSLQHSGGKCSNLAKAA